MPALVLPEVVFDYKDGRVIDSHSGAVKKRRHDAQVREARAAGFFLV